MALGVLRLWEEEKDSGGCLTALTCVSWMQGTIVRQFSCRALESLHQTFTNWVFIACSRSCRLDRGKTPILIPRCLLQAWSQCPRAMKEQQKYQTDTHHQHGRSQKTSGLCASPKSVAEPGCTVIAWYVAESHFFAQANPVMVSRRHSQACRYKHEVEAIGRVFKESPYSLVCPGIGLISLPHTLRWRDKVPVSEQQLDRDELSGAFSHLGTKQFCRYPANRSVEKGRCPTQCAMRGNCSFIRRRAQGESDVSQHLILKVAELQWLPVNPSKQQPNRSSTDIKEFNLSCWQLQANENRAHSTNSYATLKHSVSYTLITYSNHHERILLGRNDC